uniref:Putative secreted protein n=1 Tax=Amblyomma cajennense TaxID=34607 RepID=A0A023FBI1_AMBCJ
MRLPHFWLTSRPFLFLSLSHGISSMLESLRRIYLGKSSMLQCTKREWILGDEISIDFGSLKAPAKPKQCVFTIQKGEVKAHWVQENCTRMLHVTE